MKILCVSTSAILTPPVNYGGMEREVGWLVKGLNELKNDVSVLCMTGSTVPGAVWGDSEPEFVDIISSTIDDYDLIIDFSHDKLVTRTFSDKPQINTYQVMTMAWDHNPVFISKGQRRHMNRHAAPVIYYGLDWDEYPIYDGPRGEYLLYIGSLIAEKQVHWVAEVGRMLGLEVIIAGPKWQPEYWPKMDEIAEWDGITVRDEVGGQEKLDLIQKAKCLVHPVGGMNWVEAGAIIVLEALLCGTPVIATPNGCLPEYITSGINGFLANSPDEMKFAVPKVKHLYPDHCRLSVSRHTYQRMANEYHSLALEVVKGKVW